MKLSDMFFYSFNALRQRSLRSWLTVLGIVVGITSIVLLIGLVQGLRDYFTEQIATFGANTIVVVPVNLQTSSDPSSSAWLPSNGKLFLKDYERLKRVADIEEITPVITGRASIIFKDKEASSSITGVQPDTYLPTVGSLVVAKGRFLIPADKMSVVLGASVGNDSFGQDVPLSSEISISGQLYRVVGILNKSGSSFSTSDSSVFIPFSEAQAMFNSTMSDKEISTIRIKVRDGANISQVADDIDQQMLAAHRETEDTRDFSVITADFINQQLDTVLGLLGLFLGGVAGVSLLVGGVGIANTMFMSVTERRREIGILKSLGGREGEIERLFLVESSLIGMGGGAIGIFLAYSIGFLISVISGIGVHIELYVVAGAVAFSATVGIISGFFPSKQAAELDPVEALSV